MRNIKGTIKWTFEDEKGISLLGHPSVIELSLAYTFYPGEPMVRYYHDGSGYPGSPDEVEFNATILSVESWDSEQLALDAVSKKTLANWYDSEFSEDDQIREAILEDVNGNCDDGPEYEVPED